MNQKGLICTSKIIPNPVPVAPKVGAVDVPKVDAPEAAPNIGAVDVLPKAFDPKVGAVEVFPKTEPVVPPNAEVPEVEPKVGAAAPNAVH